MKKITYENRKTVTTKDGATFELYDVPDSFTPQPDGEYYVLRSTLTNTYLCTSKDKIFEVLNSSCEHLYAEQIKSRDKLIDRLKEDLAKIKTLVNNE